MYYMSVSTPLPSNTIKFLSAVLVESRSVHKHALFGLHSLLNLNYLTILRIQTVPIKSGFLVSPAIYNFRDPYGASTLWNWEAVSPSISPVPTTPYCLRPASLPCSTCLAGPQWDICVCGQRVRLMQEGLLRTWEPCFEGSQTPSMCLTDTSLKLWISSWTSAGFEQVLMSP